MEQINGCITKGIGGFYYIKTSNSIIECKAKGIFRKRKITPVAGDRVTVECENSSNVISGIFDRKNFFVRPPIANVDIFFIIVSTVEPVPSTLVIDKLAAIAVDKGVKPIIVITKVDLKSAEKLKENYKSSNIEVIDAYNEDGTISQKIIDRVKDNLCVFCGNSGVGKSTMLNTILPNLNRQTGSISKKLGRGRHTTREVEIFEAFGGFIADTPGFASIDVESICFIHKDNLQYAFPDISPLVGDCKFTGCSHTSEKGCAVIDAVKNNQISKTRYSSYLSMYEKAKEIKDWQR